MIRFVVAHAVRLDPGGRLHVVRLAPPEDPDRLRRVAASLRAAAGAGAVEVVELVDDGSRVELVLAYAGRPVSAPLPAAALATLGASLADSLASLHDRGLAHGAIRADHVLIDAAGGVRLCGFAGHGDAASDVRDLGELLLSLLDEREHSATVEIVRAAAARCTVTDPDARPTMAALAASLRAVAAPVRDIERGTGGHGRRRVALVAAVVLSAVLAFTLVSQRRPPAPPATVATRAVITSTSTSTTSTTTSTAARVWPRTVEVIHGAGATWRVASSSGDHVVLGDWDCDGVRTPAIVQPSGDVFVVDAFPSGDAVAARYVTTIAGAVGASVERRDGCDHLEVATARRRITVVLSPARAT